MDYLRGLRRLREDPDWLSKIGVGSLLLLSASIIPFLGQIVLAGWGAVMVRRAVSGTETPMPRLDLDFDYLGKLLSTGFKAFLAMMIWGLPAGILIGTGVACLYAGAIATMIGGAAAGGDGGMGGLGALCAFGVGFPLLIAVSIVLQLPAQMAGIRAELADDLNAGLQFREVLDMTKLVMRELVIGSLVLAFVQWLMMVGSMLLCGLPLIPCMVAMVVARAHFAAQLYQKYVERGGAPLQVAHPPSDGPVAPAPSTF
ncbi:DUF4013 domain-containing protein [Sandaracinus amylolyticus]|uniref:DUF4013 domain-containing protein n=1 Tax=Sandaracinus amylolyticus TaxID=927083 RepID=UPI001F3936B4|nr:DUF4013 domain-containing protein [Sandaracinus amylolyticus]UJR82618.1 Hypothetical protein I5071_46830 [Sandaracinus amylolyticus]